MESGDEFDARHKQERFPYHSYLKFHRRQVGTRAAL